MSQRSGDERSAPAVPVGGGVPIDPVTGERFGYLPRKAAQRKIIIRRALGLPWVIAALVAAALIAVAGSAFVLSQPGRPDGRYADAGPLSAYPAGSVTPLRGGEGWVDRRGGLIVWHTAEPFCPADGGWGARERWDSRGASSAGSANLQVARSQVAKNHLYVDLLRSRRVGGTAAGTSGACPSPRQLR
jgi:hypothetical protein